MHDTLPGRPRDECEKIKMKRKTIRENEKSQFFVFFFDDAGQAARPSSLRADVVDKFYLRGWIEEKRRKRLNGLRKEYKNEKKKLRCRWFFQARGGVAALIRGT